MATARKRQAPPRLSDKARKLWQKTVTDFVLREDEFVLLEQACREVDLIDEMRRTLDREGLMLSGSMGQPVAHPLLAEVRQHRQQLASLLRALKIPDGDVGSGQVVDGSVSSQARAAAQTRWSQAHGAAS